MPWQWLAAAMAQEAVEVDAVRNVAVGDAPSLTFRVAVDGQLTADLTCGSKSYALSERVAPGDAKKLELGGLAPGTWRCRGRLVLRGPSFEGEMPLDVQVSVLQPLVLTVDRGDLHLEERHLTAVASRGLKRLRVEVFGERGKLLGEGETSGGGDTRVDLQWSAADGEVLKLEVLGWDMDEFFGSVVLSPWHYSIPHEDVVFETGSSVIRPEEVPKLDAAWSDLEAVRQRYGDVVDVRLFVAGYTDTVGSDASNQGLSEARARSIATWFRNRGFDGPVAYQGFGERVLAVLTPDETDQQENRRATYILAADAPEGPEFPGARWQALGR